MQKRTNKCGGQAQHTADRGQMRKQTEKTTFTAHARHLGKNAAKTENNQIHTT